MKGIVESDKVWYPRNLDSAVCQLLSMKQGQSYKIRICNVIQLPAASKSGNTGTAALFCLAVLSQMHDPRSIMRLPISSRNPLIECLTKSSFRDIVKDMSRNPNEDNETEIDIPIYCSNTRDDYTAYIECC